MDNDRLAKIVSKIGILKHKYLGSFPADMILDSLSKDSFLICNTQSSKRPGIHWVMIAKKELGLYFGDSLGKDPKHYHNIAFVPFKEFKSLNHEELQKEGLCGFYCIYFANCLFSNFPLYDVNDNFILRFFAELL